MNFRDQRAIYQPRPLEELLVVPVRIDQLQRVADRVMLARKQGMEQAQSDPPVVVEAGKIDSGMARVRRQHAVGANRDLAVLLGADLHLLGAAVAVDLSRIPPVRVEIAERRRGAEPGFAWRLVAGGALDVHAAVDRLRPVVAGRQGDLEFVSGFGRAVAEPVVDLELNPRRGEQVECGRGNEHAARQQIVGDQPRARVQQRSVRLRHCFGERDIPGKPCPCHSHARMREAVERTVSGSPALVAGIPVAGRPHAVAGVVKIVGAQPVAEDCEIDRRNQHRKPVPAHDGVDDGIDGVQNSLQQGRVKLEPVVLARHLPPGGYPFRQIVPRT